MNSLFNKLLALGFTLSIAPISAMDDIAFDAAMLARQDYAEHQQQVANLSTNKHYANLKTKLLEKTKELSVYLTPDTTHPHAQSYVAKLAKKNGIKSPVVINAQRYNFGCGSHRLTSDESLQHNIYMADSDIKTIEKPWYKRIIDPNIHLVKALLYHEFGHAKAAETTVKVAHYKTSQELSNDTHYKDLWFWQRNRVNAKFIEEHFDIRTYHYKNSKKLEQQKYKLIHDEEIVADANIPNNKNMLLATRNWCRESHYTHLPLLLFGAALSKRISLSTLTNIAPSINVDFSDPINDGIRDLLNKFHEQIDEPHLSSYHRAYDFDARLNTLNEEYNFWSQPC